MKIKKSIASLLLAIIALLSIATVVLAESTQTYAISEHPGLFSYYGYCQVQGSYRIPQNPGYGLGNYVGKHIKRAAIDYRIGNDSIIGGRKYTAIADSKSDYNIYSVSVTAYDDITNWFGPKTVFYRWYYPFN